MPRNRPARNHSSVDKESGSAEILPRLITSQIKTRRTFGANSGVPGSCGRTLLTSRAGTSQLGTDVGGFEWARVSQAEEFVLMTGLGMSPVDALRAGTLWAAELLGLAGTAGVIEPGAAADIVAVAGDPLRDIERLQQVELVIQGGQIAWDGHRI
jgi:hypothetical protein